jgi:hypothetical protein
MEAEVALGVDTLARAPEHNVFVEESDGARLALRQIRCPGDHMPIVQQHWICQHGLAPFDWHV